jgi:hypothetical protein
MKTDALIKFRVAEAVPTQILEIMHAPYTPSALIYPVVSFINNSSNNGRTKMSISNFVLKYRSRVLNQFPHEYEDGLALLFFLPILCGAAMEARVGC